MNRSARLRRLAPSLAFFSAGLALAVGGFLLALNAATLHSGSGAEPTWLSITVTVVPALPWVVLAVLIGLRLSGRRAARPIAFAVGVLAPFALWAAYIFLGPMIADHLHRERFDPARWRANAASNPMWPTRLRMIDDLLDRDLLVGRDRDDILQLLGPPDGGDFGDAELVYWLGPERGLFRIDSERLLLDLDAGGKVATARLGRD